MSRYHSYLNSAAQILQQYKGEEPFASFLKKLFSADKKYGSKDRRQIAHLCYCYFRTGKSMLQISVEDRILSGLFLCSNEPNELLTILRPEWNHKETLSIEAKCSLLNAQCSIPNVFPWDDQLSEGIDHEKFCESFLVQPDLFLRLRPGKENSVKEKLQLAEIHFEQITGSCLALPNASKIDSILELDKEAVIQDFNSQRTGEFIRSAINNLKSKIRVWDCCAASGGKSIMAYDINPEIELTVSDIRESILANLKKRFKSAGIKKCHSLIADLSQEKSKVLNLPAGRHGLKSEIILADVPCTGSGTWSRTPEQLFFFDKNKIEEYAALQRKIISNVIPQLLPGSWLVYITCSVFKKENEENIDYIKQNFPLELKQMELLKGYNKKADSMFVALLQRKSE
jgi:16S rRNA (cytosine967-C5)-methyltransferase